MADALPPLPAGATTEMPPLPEGATMDAPPLPRGATRDAGPKMDLTPKPKDDLFEKGKRVAAETGMGAAAGALAPELFTLAGGAAAAFPLTAPVAPALFTAGQALRGQRVAQAGLGALGGLGSSIAGETAEAMGASPGTVEAIRLGGAIVVPEFANATTFIIKKGFQGLLGLNTAGAISAVAKDLGIDEAKLTPSQRAFIEKQINEIRGKAKAGVPQQQIFSALDAEAQRVSAEAAQRAAGAERAGTAAGLEEKRRAMRLAGLGEEVGASGKQVIDEAKSTVSAVGDPSREVSNIGNTIRDKIANKYSTESVQRSEAYKAQEKVRNDAVAAKESKGVFVESLPEYKSLVDDLRKKLLIGKTAREQVTAPVTEKGVLQVYQNIYDAVTARRVQVGINEMGNPVYKTFPTSFQALDDVRRRLGDAAFGKEVEGYSAIGTKLAEKYYGKISEIQSKFAGEAQDVLQRDYEMASRLLEKYKSKAGEKATALDRFDATRYKTDAQSLPRDYFKSAQSVKDLLDLTGDRAFVISEAGNYAANQLRNLKDANAVRNWKNSNSDWLKTLPEVDAKVNSYLSNLERAEGFAARSAKVQKGVEQRGKMAAEEGKVIEAAAGKEAGKITREAEKMVDRLIGSKEAPLQIKNMILSGERETWNTIAPVIAKTNRGKETLAEAVNQIMADKASTGLRSAGITFRENVAPALRRTGLMDEGKISKLQAQLDEIAKVAVNEEQKLSLAQRVLRNAITGYAAPGLYRGGSSAYDYITSMEPRR
jgi:hypothetical protein